MADGPGVTPDPDRAVGVSGAGEPVGRTFPVVAVVGALDDEVVAGAVAVVVVTGSVVVVVASVVLVVGWGRVVAVEPLVVDGDPEPYEPDPAPPDPEPYEPEPVVALELFGSDVVVVDLFLWFFCGPDDDVVALAAPGHIPSGAGPGAAATPPPYDSAPTMRSAPPAARMWGRRFRKVI